MTPAIAALIAEAERLDKEATPGKWRQERNGTVVAGGARSTCIADCTDHEENPTARAHANAAFIAAARTLLPALASALRRAERVVEAARVLDRLATPPMQSAAWDTLDAALRAHDHPDATGETGRE